MIINGNFELLLPSKVIIQSDEYKQHRIVQNADCKIKQSSTIYYDQRLPFKLKLQV